jgi:hypothetical protein
MYQGRIDVLLNGDYQVRGSTRQCILAMLEGLLRALPLSATFAV